MTVRYTLDKSTVYQDGHRVLMLTGQHDGSTSPQERQALRERIVRLLNSDEAQTDEAGRLREALDGLEKLSIRAWDRVDGGLTMFAESVPLFDEACRKARIALGRPLFGDNGETEIIDG